MSRYRSKLCCSKGGWVSEGKGRLPPTNFGDRKLESLGYHMALFA